MRLFIAVYFPDGIKAAVAKIRDQLKMSASQGRFSADGNLHLTLVFIGECDEEQAAAIMKVLDGTVFAPFTLSFGTVGCFEREGGGTWWLGLKRSGALSALQAELSARLRQSGFALESREYTPHITLGREVRMRNGYKPPEVPAAEFSVKSVELMKSEHVGGRPTYTPIYSRNAEGSGL